MGKELPDDLNTLKVTELKEALKERSLTVSGNKADLVARLQEFLNKQSGTGKASEGTPKKQAPEGEPQNGDSNDDDAKVKEKEKEVEEKEKAVQKEKEEKEKQQEQRKREEEERKQKELREKEEKEKEAKAKELKDRKEREQREKDREQEEQREREKEKEKAESKEETESNKDEDKSAQEEDKKRKNTDDEAESTETTPSRTLTKHTTSSSTTTTPTNNNKRQRTWANNSQSINISSDILKEMLPTSPSTNDAEMDDASAQHEDAGTPRAKPAQQVYSTPSRREKKEEEQPGPREVPPARKSPSTTLFIDRFVRPFTIPQVKQLLSQTGEIEYFWMNQVKSQAYVTFKSVEQATATRDAIYDLPWPPGNGSKLRAEFATDDEAKKAAEQHDLKRSTGTPTATTTPTSAPFGKEGSRDTRVIRDSRDSRDPRDSRRDSRDAKRPPPPPKKTLEDLFKKTVALPSIYWLPLTQEQITAKKATSQDR